MNGDDGPPIGIEVQLLFIVGADSATTQMFFFFFKMYVKHTP
jgi:hypothetical protein